MHLISSQQIEKKLNSLLPFVQKPGRYVGGEYNQVKKDWDSVKTHVALVFPDIYDLGLPNLGVMILYEELNKRADALCERAYLPWLDMEIAMRENGIPLYSLESKTPLAQFDLIGFTLPYETLYTNVLNALDLANIPLYSDEREATHPIIIAGGHAAYNPEPMAAFIDAYVIGEGEEAIHEVIENIQRSKDLGADRVDTLHALQAVPGVYIPSLYEPNYHPDGRFASLVPRSPKAPASISKRICATLPPPPTRFLVPSIDVVHNRIAMEIMRGCTRGCRFCHAGMVNRPVRERTVDTILNTIEEALSNTGYEEIALLSLSSSDYTQIGNLVEEITCRFKGRNLTISLPSLRIESFSVDLMEKLKGVRQGGFTLAPEAASDRMRNRINKPIQAEQLLATAREVYSRGWTTLKLYFMIGQPGETMEDVQAIADLSKAVIVEGRKAIGKRANLHVGVSTFVPKPHTPFQWASLDPLPVVLEKQNLLKDQLRGPGLKMTWSNPRETILEAALSRGDRNLSKVIETAWRKGAKFDAWQDQFNFNVWMDAFVAHNISPDFYSTRARELDETFPWDHIHTGVTRKFLQREYQRSLDGTLTDDCRDVCHACGILTEFSDLRRTNPSEQWLCPEVT
ncbi:MAG: TIGR03960 family B12-binding radical SAM protein [Anaerolineaceae bacterium]|jgi:radical SAM family uncharacterized protein